MRDGELHAAREAVKLLLAHDDDELIVFEQIAVRVDQRFIGPRLDHAGFVVQLEQRQLAALAVDNAHVGHDAGQQLRLARVEQVFNLALDKAAHLQCHFVKQMA